MNKFLPGRKTRATRLQSMQRASGAIMQQVAETRSEQGEENKNKTKQKKIRYYTCEKLHKQMPSGGIRKTSLALSR